MNLRRSSPSDPIVGAVLIAAFTFAAPIQAQTPGLNVFGDAFGSASSDGRIGVSARILVDETDGTTGILQVTADIAKGWHIYALSQPEAIGAPQAIKIQVDPLAEVSIEGEYVADAAPEIKNPDYIKVPVHEHHGKITWSARLKFSPQVDVESIQMAGKLAGQICEDDGVCVILGSDEARFTAAYDGTVSAAQRDTLLATTAQSVETPIANVSVSGVAKYVGFAMLAGFVLNFMPCVLPVIGLKIMSFVNQAGENRSRVFFLNLAFSAGLLSVFLVLATASAFFGMGWGDYLTKSLVGSVIVTSLVFAFALSMLGVWEIPIPGMSGTTGAGKLAQEEGLAGAFFLGIFTTILATPCTGPFLGSALGFTASQPAWVTYLIFGSIGLGMAVPYLLIGLNPAWISWLPKPGMWMNTFKEVMGFVLLATVVFLLQPFGDEPRSEYLISVLSLLLAVGVGCWWVGKTSLAAATGVKIRAWGSGAAMIAVGAFVGFGLLGPSEHELDYQEFSRASLRQLRAASRVVLVDFTGPG